jgi:predicted pyridoxine 5'-phosphate oxidase superfamily flavin-nucleotide-binding protein
MKVEAPMRTPFHPDELEAQRLAGGGSQGSGIRDFMADQHRGFFATLPYIVVAARDRGWPAATVLEGAPGFVSSPDPVTLRVEARLDRADPVTAALTTGAPATLLGIDLATRRRNRANGVVSAVSAEGFVLSVRQSFGNCPQYIHLREVRHVHAASAATEAFDGLDHGARAAISGANTFFVATSARVDEAAGGVDVSHRAGGEGFVRVEGETLVVPDYRGNWYFNTLGNLVAEPRAALLFVDFSRGDLLLVQGTTEIIWDGPEVRAHTGAERLWRVRVVRGFRRRSALGLRWTARPGS